VALFYAPLFMIYESGRRYVELKKAQSQIIHTERLAAKGEMAAEIGHELRTQLAAISGHAQMLLKDAERKVYEHVERRGRIIIEQSRRMEVMAKGLMDFSRAELNVERVDLNALIQRSIEFVRTQNRFDGVEWDLRLAEQVPALRGDPGQLQQVLLNLFVNAADAMKEKSSARKVIWVTSSVDDRGRLVRIVVTDTGSGIVASNLTRVFEPHFTTKPEGHGFGLSTSYRIVASHGGRITAESPPGQGASFSVTLPVNGPGGWG
jgi:signal transduction histidine kinase